MVDLERRIPNAEGVTAKVTKNAKRRVVTARAARSVAVSSAEESDEIAASAFGLLAMTRVQAKSRCAPQAGSWTAELT